MDTKVIEVRKNVSIFQGLGVAGKFSVPINIDFLPDEMKVHSVQYSTGVDPAELGLTSIYSDIVNDNIASFVDRSPNSTTTFYPLSQKPIRGTYEFQIRDRTGSINIGRAGDLFFQLEFVKYREVKEQKVL